MLTYLSLIKKRCHERMFTMDIISRLKNKIFKKKSPKRKKIIVNTDPYYQQHRKKDATTIGSDNYNWDVINEDCVTRTEKFAPYFVYSNKTNEIIGYIYLTEDQAYNINKFMQYKGKKNQEIVFLRS